MSISVSTHVLDVERGRPASGVPVELYRGDETEIAREQRRQAERFAA